jgi:hypothetical protein
VLRNEIVNAKHARAFWRQETHDANDLRFTVFVIRNACVEREASVGSHHPSYHLGVLPTACHAVHRNPIIQSPLISPIGPYRSL